MLRNDGKLGGKKGSNLPTGAVTTFLCAPPVVIPVLGTTMCQGFPQDFSFNLHKEPGAGALLYGAKPIPALDRFCLWLGGFCL